MLKNQLRRSLFLNLIKLNASNCHLIKMESIRGFARILSKFHTIRYDLLEFSENLFQRTPLDGCFHTFQKHLFFRTILYLKKSEKSMTLWITLLPSAKKSNSSGFYCISIAVTDIILHVVCHLEHDGIIILHLIEGMLSCFRVSLLIFEHFFRKVIKNGYLPSTKHLEICLKLFISYFNCP